MLYFNYSNLLKKYKIFELEKYMINFKVYLFEKKKIKIDSMLKLFFLFLIMELNLFFRLIS